MFRNIKYYVIYDRSPFQLFTDWTINSMLCFYYCFCCFAEKKIHCIFCYFCHDRLTGQLLFPTSKNSDTFLPPFCIIFTSLYLPSKLSLERQPIPTNVICLVSKNISVHRVGVKFWFESLFKNDLQIIL